MMPSALQVPPYPDAVLVSVCGAAPPKSRRFSAVPEKKPIEWPSGDQNGNVPPSVPGSGCAVANANDRNHRREPPALEAANTICRPSGERANDEGSSVAGVTMS